MEVASDCCRLRYLIISSDTSRLAASSLHFLSQGFRNQNVFPSPVEEMAFEEVVYTA